MARSWLLRDGIVPCHPVGQGHGGGGGGNKFRPTISYNIPESHIYIRINRKLLKPEIRGELPSCLV